MLARSIFKNEIVTAAQKGHTNALRSYLESRESLHMTDVQKFFGHDLFYLALKSKNPDTVLTLLSLCQPTDVITFTPNILKFFGINPIKGAPISNQSTVKEFLDTYEQKVNSQPKPL